MVWVRVRVTVTVRVRVEHRGVLVERGLVRVRVRVSRVSVRGRNGLGLVGFGVGVREGVEPRRWPLRGSAVDPSAAAPREPPRSPR